MGSCLRPLNHHHHHLLLRQIPSSQNSCLDSFHHLLNRNHHHLFLHQIPTWLLAFIVSILIIAISFFVKSLLRRIPRWLLAFIISIVIVTASFSAESLLHQIPNWILVFIFSIVIITISFFAKSLLRYSRKDANRSDSSKKKVTVVFVLGGPGSGKSTQCANIVKHFGYTHLSAGDLLRAEIDSGSKNGTMIQKLMVAGKIVPSEITIELLLRAMQESENDKFLIDGFPRNEENRATFENIPNIVPEFVLFLDCSEEELKKRLLSRNQGREDDNIETIRKRFKVFKECTLPVIEYYRSIGKVHKIDTAKPAEDAFNDIKRVFSLHGAKAT